IAPTSSQVTQKHLPHSPPPPMNQKSSDTPPGSTHSAAMPSHDASIVPSNKSSRTSPTPLRLPAPLDAFQMLKALSSHCYTSHASSSSASSKPKAGSITTADSSKT